MATLEMRGFSTGRAERATGEAQVIRWYAGGGDLPKRTA